MISVRTSDCFNTALALLSIHMTSFEWFGFLSLGAIWGSSFVFMRILAPILGAVPTACLRVLIAGSVLLIYFLIAKVKIDLRKNLKHYLVMGLLNAAFPFLFFAFAALHIPAGLSVILNGTAPLFTVILAVIFLSEKVTRYKVLSLTLGTLGVLLIALRGEFAFDEFSMLAILAGLGAAFCYGLGGIYMKKSATNINPVTMTGLSQFIGGIVILPFAIAHWYQHPNTIADFTPKVVTSLMFLSLLCSGTAFIIFYKLIARVGPSRAITATYLIPAFGIAWGFLFLGEGVTLSMMSGCVLILLGIKVSTLSLKPRSNI